MLLDKFTNRGNAYIMTLVYNGASDNFVVSIKSDEIHSPEKSYDAFFESFNFPSYDAACSKFRSVYRWNHGQQPSLPTMYDFLKDYRVHASTQKEAYYGTNVD